MTNVITRGIGREVVRDQARAVGARPDRGRRGLNATSIRETAKHARAPLGSTYHYFPEGKQQLVTEAVRFTGDATARARDNPLFPCP